MFFMVLREFSASCFECVKITVVFFTHNRRNKMLKSREFLSEKSRGIVSGGTKLASPAPVILGLVPGILSQQGTNLVNKLALFLHKCQFAQDSRDKPENDGCWSVGCFSMSHSFNVINGHRPANLDYRNRLCVTA